MVRYLLILATFFSLTVNAQLNRQSLFHPSGVPACVASWDADALNFYNREVAQGYTMTCTEQQAVNTYVLGLKSNNLWVKMVDIGLEMIGGNVLVAHKQTLKGAFSQGIAVGIPVSSSGVGPLNGTTQYITTTINPAVSLTLNNTHLAVYSQSATETSGDAIDFSSANNVGTEFALVLPRSNGQMYSIQYNETASQGMLNAAAGTGITDAGFWIGDRPSATEHKLYRNGVVLLSQTTSGGAMPNTLLSIGVNGLNNAQQFSTKKYSYWSVGQGLTATEAATYTSLVNQLHTTLGINTY